ncbi:MAG: clan AA aspartic protease, partial [Candidatus Hydrogenedentes bacterium]|nr:clan AA aspartic protease [Candidatus Hydrogenedentota bacterium]
MIAGVVTANGEAKIKLIVAAAKGELKSISAVIDTGFTGFLSLPSTQIESLDLTWFRHAEAILADGSAHLFNVYCGTVIWDGVARTIEVDAADTDPLVGMGMMSGYGLRIDGVAGG